MGRLSPPVVAAVLIAGVSPSAGSRATRSRDRHTFDSEGEGPRRRTVAVVGIRFIKDLVGRVSSKATRPWGGMGGTWTWGL